MAKKQKAQESLEDVLWKSADKLRKNIDAAEYKHIVLGLIFLRYISDGFEKLYQTLLASSLQEAEDKDEYLAENLFFVPPKARWSYLLSCSKLPTIGKIVDEAMIEIEKENPSLKGVLPKVYAKDNLDSKSLGALLDLIANIALEQSKEESADILGRVFEFFLGEFALAEGKQGGQFYTPKSVVELLVNMLEPYKGRVFDPCCGSGGMFIQSEKFIKEHQGRIDSISIYGQESNQTTWRLAKMNLAIAKIDSAQVKWNAEGSFLQDAHPDLKADFIIANPPFNDSDWSGELLKDDKRWKYGIPPANNANYAWIQHFIYHLSPINGLAGFVLAKGSLTSNSSGEGEIRKALIEDNLIECIVNLPAKLFLNTQIPACLWFVCRGRKRSDTLFIDARNLGEPINRKNKILPPSHIAQIADTYHKWLKNAGYEDIAGFCKSATLEEIRSLDYTLTPGRYVGLEESEEEFDFKSEFARLKAELEEQMREEIILNERIRKSLEKIEQEMK